MASFSYLHGVHVNQQVFAAWDISPVANHVYHHNHNLAPSPSSIETLDVATLDRWRSDLWMLSPPCQPHTRNNTTVRTKSSSSPPKPLMIILPHSIRDMAIVLGYESRDRVIAFNGL